MLSTDRTVVLIICLIWDFPSIVKALIEVAWWSSVAQLSAHHSPAVLNNKPFCLQLEGLSPGQARICELFRDHMPAVGHGAKEAIRECQRQFKDNRWNCSTSMVSGYIGPVHKKGTREAAFTYSILSAGVAHEVGRRCRLGELNSCGCSSAARPVGLDHAWVWGGCGDNVDYGSRFSRDFIDVREREQKFGGGKRQAGRRGRTLMNRWNNEVGRRLLKRKTRPKCKCHGVSGACNLRTCWLQFPTLHDVGAVLGRKYQSARRIQINHRGNMQALEGGGRVGGGRTKKRSLRQELVFLDDSPDYCRLDMTLGTLGTKGRLCNRHARTSRGCELLCCGRGFRSFFKVTSSKCGCRFHWCCRVICQTCLNRTTVDVCN